MIQIAPQMKAYIAIEPIDFRKGIDSLVGLCKYVLDSDPFSGYLFLFTNKRKVGIKILVYDEQGFWLCYKRLSRGSMVWWPESLSERKYELSILELRSILMNIDPSGLKYQDFKKVLRP